MRLLVPNSLLLALVGVLVDPGLSQEPARTHNKGEVSGRVEWEYDLLLTQCLVAQPRFETNRYEIRREFAPYVGVSWTSRFGETADFARARGDVVRTLGLLVGVRLWR